MILVSKLVLGSVAMATVAGSVVFTDAVEAARSMTASMGWGSEAQGRAAVAQPVVMEQPAAWQPHAQTHGSGQFPGSLQHCPGRCDIGMLFQIR